MRHVLNPSKEDRAKGAHRMREIAQANAAAIREAVAGLLQSLGREPNTADLAAAELIGATMVRARYLRSLGKRPSTRKTACTHNAHRRENLSASF
jgi:hypothetical protein